MSSRNLKQYILLSLKGIAMGAADVVPGVSGGTIAFISGIYEELIETIHKLDFGFFKVWKKEGVSKAWKGYNLGFLFVLFAGVLTSILSLAKIITWLLANHPILVWSFFFGLVIASIVYISNQITRWNLRSVFAIIIAAGLSYFITIIEPVGTPDSTWFLFFAGFIAIIAMILPGISGSFILLLLGAYEAVMRTVTQFIEGVYSMDWALFSEAFIKLMVFALGAILGLKTFSRVLNWMFKHHKNTTLAVLTGFMIGALNKIWPWKEVVKYRTNHSGEEVPFLEKSILPTQSTDDPQLLFAIVFVVLGFLTIFILERTASVKKNR